MDHEYCFRVEFDTPCPPPYRSVHHMNLVYARDEDHAVEKILAWATEEGHEPLRRPWARIVGVDMERQERDRSLVGVGDSQVLTESAIAAPREAVWRGC